MSLTYPLWQTWLSFVTMQRLAVRLHVHYQKRRLRAHQKIQISIVEISLQRQNQILWVGMKKMYFWVLSKTQKEVLLQVVIGGINVDFIAKGKTKKIHVRFHFMLSIHMQICRRKYINWLLRMSFYLFQFGQTNPGSVCQSFGGVGRNIAGLGFFFSTLSNPVHAHFHQNIWLLHLALSVLSSRLSEQTRPGTPVHFSYWIGCKQWCSV